MKRKILIFGGLILLGIAMAIALSQLPPNWFKPDYLVDISSILTLISFTVRSMLALRLLAIGAQLTFIPYAYFQPTPLWTPIVWNLLFALVNVFNIVVLLLEQRPVVFNPDEQKLYNLTFNTMKPREFLKLLTVGEWRDGEAGEEILSPNNPSAYVSILCHGEAVAYVEDRDLLKIPEGKLLGSPSALVGEPSLVGVKLSTPSRYMRWSVVQLRQYLDQRPEMREKIQSIVSRDLIETLRGLEELELSEARDANVEQSVQKLRSTQHPGAGESNSVVKEDS
jgi:CRP-like cAMP-binding protein